MGDHSNIESIFCSAIEIELPEERDLYIQRACSDDKLLRGQVLRLLHAHFHGGSILDLPANGLIASIDRPIAEGPGTLIGPYKLIEQIGEGGFGVVFLAEQERPFRRKVALKVIKPGMDTRQVIARFEAERQALAMMDHPNIAKVLEAGATESGRPYFVMELVQGVLVTEYCDQCNLATPERLELFITVCQAVQHAHQKGIIHRDIKPTNVLVAMQDGMPTPKIIDFGVAKAIDQRLTEHTLTTAFAQMVGTPLYMSPEQAELSPLGVDTRSDIYSLGVLLYELLTGTTPFDKERLHEASYDELRRIIREEEPPRPAPRISTLAADLATTVAERRRTEARCLSQQVRGELDWIVMKCLEKDRNWRYESAGSLARDVERYLHDEPVQACPPSTSYRFRKFARRNKSLLAAGGAIAVALVMGLGISTWMYFRATTESARAQAVSGLLEEMLASSNPDQIKGPQYTVRQLLDDFSAGLRDQLAGQREVEASIRTVIGKSYNGLGVNGPAELHFKKALDLRREAFGAHDELVADSLVDYAWSLPGPIAEQERNVREALAIYRKQNSDPRLIVRALWALQMFLKGQSRLAEAEEVANNALALAGDEQTSDYADLANILHALADAKLTEGKPAEAEQFSRRAVAVHRRLHRDHHPETAWGLFGLGLALADQRKFEEAEKPLRESLAIFRERYTGQDGAIQAIQIVSRQLKSVLEAKGDRAGVEALAREEAEQFTRSDSPGYHVRLAELLLSNDPPSDAQQDEARRLIRWSIEEYGQIAVDFPKDLRLRLNAAAGFVDLIRICAATQGFANEVDEVNRRLSAELPQITLDAKRLGGPAAFADALYYVALIQMRLGDEAGYRDTCKALVELPFSKLEGVTESRPIWTPCIGPTALEDLNLHVKRAEDYLANTPRSDAPLGLCLLGAAHYRAGQYEQASQRLQQSIAAFAGADTASNSINYPRLFLAMTRCRLRQNDQARRVFAETLPEVEKELQSPWILWNRRATLELLREEAESLIKKDQPNAAPSNDNPTPISTLTPPDP